MTALLTACGAIIVVAGLLACVSIGRPRALLLWLSLWCGYFAGLCGVLAILAPPDWVALTGIWACAAVGVWLRRAWLMARDAQGGPADARMRPGPVRPAPDRDGEEHP